MALFMGQFLISGELLNKVAAPLLKKQYRFLRELSFRIVDDFVMAEIAGRYNLLGFKGFVAVHLLEFFFARTVCRIDLRLSVEMRPRFLKPLLMSLLKKKLSRRPGVSWSGSRLRLEPAEMPFFSQINEKPAWRELFSILEITRDGQDSRGLLFNLYLHEPY
jgi:hypothetical protein